MAEEFSVFTYIVITMLIVLGAAEEIALIIKLLR